MAIESATPLLKVYDVPAAVAFYRDVLGFEVVNTSKPLTAAKEDYGWALLRMNGIELMLNNAYENNIRPERPDPARSQAHTDIILYLSCRDLDGACAHLRAHGINAPDPKVAYYGMRQVFIRDPDGYGLCLQWPADPIAS